MSAAAIAQRYRLGRPERAGDGWTQTVLGARQSEHGGATYFVSLQEKRFGVPRFRASFCDGGRDLSDAGLQRGGRWRELAEGATLGAARAAVRRHFEATFGELSRRSS